MPGSKCRENRKLRREDARKQAKEPFTYEKVNWTDLEFHDKWTKSKTQANFYMRYIIYKGVPLRFQVDGVAASDCKSSLSLVVDEKFCNFLADGDAFFKENLGVLGADKKSYRPMGEDKDGAVKFHVQSIIPVHNSEGKSVDIDAVTMGKRVSTCVQVPYVWKTDTACGVTIRCCTIKLVN